MHLAIVKTCASCGNKSHSRTKKCNCGAEFKVKSAKEHAKEVKHPNKTWNLLQRKVHTYPYLNKNYHLYIGSFIA